MQAATDPNADPSLEAATGIAERALADPARRPVVTSLFDPATFTATHVVHDPASRAAAIIDPVLDYDAAAGRTATRSAEAIATVVEREGLRVDWLIETHVHADHLSAAPWLKARLGGRIAIGARIAEVQGAFARIFNAEPGFAPDGSQFDHLFADGETLALGAIEGIALHVPGHTPADTAFLFGDAGFVGDTLFMPDYGTARCDFPGGSAALLYRSIHRLLALPDETRLYMCHDYKAPGRDEFAWLSSVAAQRAGNIHIRDGVSEADFVAMREARDATLSMPALILPSVQVNMRGGRLPPAESDGVSYLKIPVDRL